MIIQPGQVKELKLIERDFLDLGKVLELVGGGSVINGLPCLYIILSAADGSWMLNVVFSCSPGYLRKEFLGRMVRGPWHESSFLHADNADNKLALVRFIHKVAMSVCSSV